MTTVQPTITSVDTRGLQKTLAEIAEIFYRRGADDTMVQKFVKNEAAKLAAQAADNLGPRSESSGTKYIRSSVGKVLIDKNYTSIFERTNQQGSSGDFKWITAGPGFLLGYNPKDDMRNASNEAVFNEFRSGQKTPRDGRKYLNLGQRGKQKLIAINRPMVKPSSFKYVVNQVREALGKAKASFASTAISLDIKKTFPKWVTRHLATVKSEGRSILETGMMNDSHAPAVEFGSHAPGVESNPRMVESLENAATVRQKKSIKTLERLIAGAVFNINNGTTYKVTDRELEDGEL